MTPRALLTAIGATAIAFTVVIGAAAGGTSGATSPVVSPVAVSVGDDRAQSALRAAPGTLDEAGSAVAERLVSRNDSCVIAL